MKRATAPAFVFALCLSGCGGSATTQPPTIAVNPVASSTLQFAVGVATISTQGGATVSKGLNVVETLRGSAGLSGVLYDVPSITGPTTLAITSDSVRNLPITAQFAGSDYGTNRITQATLDQPQYARFFAGPLANGIGSAIPSVGAFGYGLCPCNANSGPANGVAPMYSALGLPIYYAPALYYYGGPPLFPSVAPEMSAQGFVGYSIGFTDFAIAPVLGAYRLDVAVPPAFQTPSTSTAPVLSATAQLTSLSGLPAFATPTFTSDSRGGGSIAMTIPVGAAEAMAFVEADPLSGSSGTLDACNNAHRMTSFYTVLATGSGTHVLSLPDTLGVPDAGGAPTASICSAQTYRVYAVAFDYPAYEAAYPNDLSQTPTMTSASGQADLSTSDATTGVYQ